MARLAVNLGCLDENDFIRRALRACGGNANPAMLREAWRDAASAAGPNDAAKIAWDGADRIEALGADVERLREALAGALNWMEETRASGDAGNWDWEAGDVYSHGLAVLEGRPIPSEPPDRSLRPVMTPLYEAALKRMKNLKPLKDN